MLDRLDALSHGVVSNDHASALRFSRQCDHVREALLKHMVLEAALVVPLLRSLNDRGKVDANEVLRNHDALRRCIEEVYVLATTAPTAASLEAVRAFGRVLRADMDREEALFASRSTPPISGHSLPALGGVARLRPAPRERGGG